MSNDQQMEDLFKFLQTNSTIVIEGFPGAGKSQFATWVANTKLQNVIFLCLSHAQAIEKENQFKAQGINCQRILSKSEKIRLKLEISRSQFDDRYMETSLDPLKPYSYKDKEIIHDLSCKLGVTPNEAKEILSEMKSDELHVFNEGRINIGTIAQDPILRGKDLSGCVIFYDDPIRAQVSRYVEVNPKCVYSDLPKIELFYPNSDKSFFVYEKSLDMLPGFGLNCPKVFTTAESITSKVIQKNFGAVRYFFDSPQLKCNLTMFATEMVWEKYDSMIKPFVLGNLQNTVLIGDGCNADYNHYNVKGNNSLSAGHVIVELSQQMINNVVIVCLDICDSANPSSDVIFNTEIELMVDLFHQAVGRNQGNRFKGGEAIVLISPKHAQSVFDKIKKDYPDAVGYFTKRKIEGKKVMASLPVMARQVAQFIVDPIPFFEKPVHRSHRLSGTKWVLEAQYGKDAVRSFKSAIMNWSKDLPSEKLRSQLEDLISKSS